jgi:hypothetical protein
MLVALDVAHNRFRPPAERGDLFLDSRDNSCYNPVAPDSAKIYTDRVTIPRLQQESAGTKLPWLRSFRLRQANGWAFNVDRSPQPDASGAFAMGRS